MASTETAAPAATTENAAPPKAPGVMLPLVAVFVLMPALAYGLTQYVLIPKLRASLPAATEEGAPAAGAAHKPEAKSEKAAAAPKKAEGKGEKGSAESAENNWEFKDVIVNLSGAFGTRYLKTSFTASGADARLPDLVKANQKRLHDVTITILSARTLNDLDNPTAKNAIREELTAKFNQVLGVDIVEEIYFSEFVIQ